MTAVKQGGMLIMHWLIVLGLPVGGWVRGSAVSCRYIDRRSMLARCRAAAATCPVSVYDGWSLLQSLIIYLLLSLVYWKPALIILEIGDRRQSILISASGGTNIIVDSRYSSSNTSIVITITSNSQQ